MTKLTDAERDQALKTLPQWKLKDGKLERELRFPDFAAAMKTVNRIAETAEAAGHHPDIDIRYNVVTLGLITHDANGITASDTAMAARLDRELSQH